MLADIIWRGREGYAARLREILELREALSAIPLDGPEDAPVPRWTNAFLPGLDAAALYALIATTKPRRYVEVGSGHSTRFARRAVDDHQTGTSITSIDPMPRAVVDSLCDHVHRVPVEHLELDVFSALEAGDVLFVDNSHRCFTNSDVTMVFLDVLPRLRPGVLVQIHDVFLPYDYPPEWSERYYSEQYLLATALLARGPHLEVHLPCYAVSQDPELGPALDPLWDDPRLRGVSRHGVSFWLRTG